MQLVKRRFFAMRNGVVAEALRPTAPHYRVIFGLTLPQIAEVASSAPHTVEMAEQLWADRRTRESQLLAPMLYPPEQMERGEAERWVGEVATAEVADILCHRLLRHLPYAAELALGILDASEATPLMRYTALRLLRNLMPARRAEAAAAAAAAAAELAADSPLTRSLCRNILELVGETC